MCNPCLMVCFDTLRSLKVQNHVSASRFLKVRRLKNVSFSRCDPCRKVRFDTLRYLTVQRHNLAGVGGLNFQCIILVVMIHEVKSQQSWLGDFPECRLHGNFQCIILVRYSWYTKQNPNNHDWCQIWCMGDKSWRGTATGESSHAYQCYACTTSFARLLSPWGFHKNEHVSCPSRSRTLQIKAIADRSY